ncbi:MAG: hypothetical protein IID32_07495, partial [Planctomycetes bacterium]|nr:hypothetical protein [Planctomycetota bacterium]
MKLLMLNYEFPPIGAGAANAHLQLLTQFTQHHDLTVDVLTSGMRTSLLREKFSETITIHKVPLHKKDLHYWRKIEVLEWLYKAKKIYHALLAENTYDLVHAFFGFPFPNSGRNIVAVNIQSHDFGCIFECNFHSFTSTFLFIAGAYYQQDTQARVMLLNLVD